MRIDISLGINVQVGIWNPYDSEIENKVRNKMTKRKIIQIGLRVRELMAESPAWNVYAIPISSANKKGDPRMIKSVTILMCTSREKARYLRDSADVVHFYQRTPFTMMRSSDQFGQCIEYARTKANVANSSAVSKFFEPIYSISCIDITPVLLAISCHTTSKEKASAKGEVRRSCMSLRKTVNNKAPKLLEIIKIDTSEHHLQVERYQRSRTNDASLLCLSHSFFPSLSPCRRHLCRPSPEDCRRNEAAKSLHSAGSFASGTAPPGPLKKWISDGTLSLLESLENVHASPKFNLARQIVRRQVKVRAGRKAWWTRKAREMEETQKAGNVRRLLS
ncbi:hypothetical protein CLF_108423 [Clonorchis sinensis]|uniref:ATP-binding cassette transporter n=1 Tax=Clonorchis sinensis TaxID=79923 RepID=G7YRM0_CLOSI|nr:hypothetical protein CLF_108423 [Clonorchis sinensis]